VSNEPNDQAPEELVPDAEAASADVDVTEPVDDVEPVVEAGHPQVALLEEKIAGLNDQLMRSHAEAQNIRRRSELDIEKARKYSLDKFVSDLLPVADNLERAIGAIDGDSEAQKPVLEGVELTLRSLQDTLKRHHVEVVDPEGEPFNPELHQAMSMVPNPDVEPNTVLNVFQKGYTLSGRLVRPAMVVVSNGT